MAAGTWFTPRPFGIEQAADPDGLLTAPAAPETAAPAPVVPAPPGPLIVEAVIDSLRGAGVGPPRELWLPPLGVPPAADDLVARLRGRPWQIDYGDNPGLRFPIALEDRPREHRQDVYCLDLLSDNALIVAAPKRGATTAVMTLIATGALLYRPQRVQFYCIAASGPQLAALADLPHVASVVPVFDTEGVARLVATVAGIVEDRERAFAAQGLDMATVREAKFGPGLDVGVDGGDVVLIVDGWANFTEAAPQQAEAVISLLRARNYGVRVLITHTSHLAGLRSAIRIETGQELELRLTDPRESEIDRVDGVNRAREVPDTPGRGLSRTAHHLMVGVPELAAHPGGRVPARGLAEVVRAVAGADEAARVLRLPESVAIDEVLARADPARRREVVPFGLSERTLGPAYVDFAADAHVVAVGRSQSGRTNFLRVLMRGVMAQYRAEEATIVLIDPRRRLVGVVPEEWLSRYSYAHNDIRAVTASLTEVLEQRLPPPGTSQHDMLTKQFWTGRRLFVVIDDITSWSQAENPLAALAPFVEQADQLGLHIVAAADIRSWSYQSQGPGVLGRITGTLSPVLILDGRREHGPIVSGVFAEPQRPGKGLLVTSAGSEGVLVGWSAPPVGDGA